MKPVQYFTDEYLEYCQKLSPDQIMQFLEQVFKIYCESQARLSPMQSSISKVNKLKPISIRIPENLLSAFKTKSKLSGKPYQTKIKELMESWIKG